MASGRPAITTTTRGLPVLASSDIQLTLGPRQINFAPRLASPERILSSPVKNSMASDLRGGSHGSTELSFILITTVLQTR